MSFSIDIMRNTFSFSRQRLLHSLYKMYLNFENARPQLTCEQDNVKICRYDNMSLRKKHVIINRYNVHTSYSNRAKQHNDTRYNVCVQFN